MSPYVIAGALAFAFVVTAIGVWRAIGITKAVDTQIDTWRALLSKAEDEARAAVSHLEGQPSPSESSGPLGGVKEPSSVDRVIHRSPSDTRQTAPTPLGDVLQIIADREVAPLRAQTAEADPVAQAAIEAHALYIAARSYCVGHPDRIVSIAGRQASRGIEKRN